MPQQYTWISNNKADRLELVPVNDPDTLFASIKLVKLIDKEYYRWDTINWDSGRCSTLNRAKKAVFDSMKELRDLLIATFP